MTIPVSSCDMKVFHHAITPSNTNMAANDVITILPVAYCPAETASS